MGPTDDDQFAAIFRRHYTRLTVLAHRILGDGAEAEDVAQEALIALRDDPIARRSDDEIAAWLHRVTTNRSLNRLRSRRRADARAAIVGARQVGGALDAPGDRAVEDEERERVRACLALLPERQATALVLRHTGHSYREIAVALGVADGSVGVLLRRGEAAFRRAHEEMFPASNQEMDR